MEPWVVILLVLVAIIGVVVYIAAKSDPEPKPKPKPQRAPQRDVPVRRASPNINVQPGVTPISVDPVPAPSVGAATNISPSHSFIKITPDEDWRDSPTAGLHEAGDMVRIEVEARDPNGQPLGGVPVRGIINLQTGSALGATPPTDVTGPGGYAHFFYVMKDDDVGKSKLITAVLLDSAGNSITLKPTALS